MVVCRFYCRFKECQDPTVLLTGAIVQQAARRIHKPGPQGVIVTVDCREIGESALIAL